MSRLALLAITGASLTACVTTTEPHSAHFGQATAQNRAVHDVAPTAEQKNDTYIPADASRQAIAREKYRNNEIEDLETVTTN